MAEAEEVFDVRAAARYLRVHEETIRRLARQGRIPAFRVGKKWRINRGALDRWAEAQRPARPAARVLVVDDDAAVRETIGRTLAGEGMEVIPAGNGVEALGELARRRPDVVLLDLKLPGADGATVLREIRRSYGPLPVIIITGYPDGELMREAMRFTPLLLLAKPVGPEQVLQAVRLALDGSMSEAAGRKSKA